MHRPSCPFPGPALRSYPAVNKKNNLGCAYGNDVLRFLSCDITAMRQLALENTPVNDKSTTIITLVNDVPYGGTGGGRYSSVYAGEWEQCTTDTNGCFQICTADEEGCPAGVKEYWKSKAGNSFMQVRPTLDSTRRHAHLT